MRDFVTYYACLSLQLFTRYKKNMYQKPSTARAFVNCADERPVSTHRVIFVHLSKPSYTSARARLSHEITREFTVRAAVILEVTAL